MLSKIKLEAARELIEEKKYDEARAILRTLKTDPTAQRWLAELDVTEPEPDSRAVLLLAVALVVLLVVLVIGGAFVLLTRNQPTETPDIAAQVPTVALIVSETQTAVPAAALTVTSVSLTADLPTETQVTPRESSLMTTLTHKWGFRSEVSAVDDTTSAILSLEADEPIQASLHDTTPILNLRCTGARFDAYIFVNAQIANTYGRFRFGTNAPLEVAMTESDNGDALFFPEGSPVVVDLINHDSLIFEFNPFNAAPDDTVFDLRGLRDALPQLTQSCGTPFTFALTGMTPTPRVGSLFLLDSMQLMESPDPLSREVGTVRADTQFMILAVSDDGLWYQVQLRSGEIGWVGQMYVNVDYLAQDVAPTAGPSTATAVPIVR